MPATSVYHVPPFRVDVHNEQLWREADEVHLTPKAFAVLRHLLDHAGELVTKEALLAAVWPEAYVSEAALVVCIRELCQALGDQARSPRFVETVHRRGYRFIAAVEVPPGDAVMPSEAPVSAPAVSSLPESPPPVQSTLPVEAERRQLTVLFCDLEESTALSRQLDPEDYRELIQAYHETCAEVIDRYEGYVAQYLGDGLLVYFGWPQAHEDDAQRAVRAALGMLEAMQGLNRGLEQEHGLHLAMRLGVHTGLVVVGELGGAGRQEPLALGEVPNVAARLQGLAESDAIILSEATHRLVHGFFDLEALGEHILRGVLEPVTVYRVHAESGARNRLEIALTLTPLIGREQEVGLLLERWRHVQDGRGQVVLLSGEAGIGKSRLIQVLTEQITGDAHTQLECRSSPYYQNTALYPLVEMLERTFGFGHQDTTQGKLRKLETTLSRYGLEIDTSVPLLAVPLSIALSDERYPPLTMTPQQRRQRGLETIIALLLAMSEREPVLLILEDLHWSDPTTLEFLDLLVAQIPTVPLYVLLTCRPTFQPAWSHRSYLTEVTVNRLSQHQIERMAEQVASDKRLPAEVLYQVVEKTDGVPLYVEELTKAVLESGFLKEADGEYQLVGPVSSLSIPTTLHDSLMARLDRLGTAKAVAQYGSVIGRQFSYALLQAVCELDDSTLERELGHLLEAELVYQRGVMPQSTYLFKHVLVQETAYESLLKRTRQTYHRRIAHLLEGRFPEVVETQPEWVAHHALRGEVWDKAVIYFRQAGKKALGSSAYREAVSCFEQGLEAIDHLPKSRTMQEQAIDFCLDLRRPLLILGESEQLFNHLRCAEPLAETISDRRRQSLVASYLSHYFCMAGDQERAIEVGQRALAFAMAVGDVDLQDQPLYNLGRAYQTLGDYRQAINFFGKTDYGWANPGGWPVWCLAELGQFAEGITRSNEAIRLAESGNQLVGVILASMSCGHLYLRKGDLHHAITELERGLSLSQKWDIRLYSPAITSSLGYVYALSGRFAEALLLLEEGVEQATSIPVLAGHTLWVAWLSEGYLRSGRLTEAIRLAKHALVLALERKERGHQAWSLWLHGQIAMHRESPELQQAETCYQQALTLADELGMRPLQAHCHRGLGIRYSQTGQAEPARRELSTATELYRDMEMTFWLPETEVALSQVE